MPPTGRPPFHSVKFNLSSGNEKFDENSLVEDGTIMRVRFDWKLAHYGRPLE
jgi:hypothetical protein